MKKPHSNLAARDMQKTQEIPLGSVNPLIEVIDQVRHLEHMAAEATDYQTAVILKATRNDLTKLNEERRASKPI